MNKNNQNLSHLFWRVAIKQYDPNKKLTEEQVFLLTETARLAPTSRGMQPIKLYVVSDQKIKDELSKVGYNQPQFTTSSHIFVFAAKQTLTKTDVNEYISRVSSQRNTSLSDLERYKESLLKNIQGKSDKELHSWSTKQAYLVLGMVLDVAAKNNIDTSPMEGFDAEGFDKVLDIKKDGFHSVVVMAAGFRSEEVKYSKLPKVRKAKEEFVKEI